VLVGIADLITFFYFFIFFKDLKVLVPDQALQRNNIHTLANHEWLRVPLRRSKLFSKSKVPIWPWTIGNWHFFDSSNLWWLFWRQRTSPLCSNPHFFISQ